MGNNDINKTENILIKVDDNNIVFIDPNSVINNNVVEQRDVPSENLVMYVNLEADLVPRTVLAFNGDATNSTSTVASIAKGQVNILKNSKGRDFDTTWTEAFSSTSENGKDSGVFYQSDATAQTFGIDSINVTIKGYTVPMVTINFTDVRGKTLFESPKNSPYKTFFHLPWPLFYLTIKGYYGKAVKYRLHLTKFSSRYNESNGNFDITCTFIGSTFAFLADIPLAGALNAPYMYGVETKRETNKNTNTTTINISKSSKGYALLNSVYDEYKTKNLIPKNFPVKTLREVVVLAKSLDEILEREIMNNNVKPQIFTGLNEFGKILGDFEITLTQWQNEYLSSVTRTDLKGTDLFFKLSDKESKKDTHVFGNDNNALEFIVKDFIEKFKKCKILTQSLSDATFSQQGFKKQVFTYVQNVDSTSVSSYVISKDGDYWINIDSLINKVYQIRKSFDEQFNKFQKEIENLMNTIVKDKTKGFGFEPTVRNIFAVICANADVLIRLMKDVHFRAFNVGEERKKFIKGFSDETPNDNNIYPWPEIKRNSKDSNGKEIIYPGIKELRNKLHTDNPRLWPEVEFIEEYEKLATKKVDTLSTKETGVNLIDYKFDSNSELKNIKPISNILNIGSQLPYYDKSISSVIYEIYERAVSTTFLDEFDNTVINELFKKEFENVQTSFEEDYVISESLKKINGFSRTNITQTSTTQGLQNLLDRYSPNNKYPYYLDGIFTTDYIKNAYESPFKIEQNIEDTLLSDNGGEYGATNNFLNGFKAPEYRKFLYPFNSPLYLSYINSPNIDNDFASLNVHGTYVVNTTEGSLIMSPKNKSAWTQMFAYNNLFTQNLQISGNSFNILNAPFFHKQLLFDFNTNTSNGYGKYKGAAYLLLNSLPFVDLEDDIILGNNSVRLSSVLREVNATHHIPYHLILKWGAIYHRYKTYLNEGIDILSGASIDVDNKLLSPNLQLFFNGVETDPAKLVYNINGKYLSYSSENTIGFYPFYQDIFHQVVNGNGFFDITNPDTYQLGINNKIIYVNDGSNPNGKNITYWTTIVDTSQISETSNHYTIVPSCGNTDSNSLDLFNDLNKNSQVGFKTILQKENITNVISGNTFFGIDEYNLAFDDSTNRTFDKTYTLTGKNRKIFDLIATFSPDILDNFENMFLDFASESSNSEIPQKTYQDYITKTSDDKTQTHSVSYQNFQELLRDIVTVTKLTTDKQTYSFLIDSLPDRQKQNFIDITKKILSEDNLLKVTLGNSKEYDLYTIENYLRPKNVQINYFGKFDSAQAVPNLNNLKVYLGTTGGTLDDLTTYLNFFQYSDIELNVDNIKSFRPLIFMWNGFLIETKRQYLLQNNNLDDYTEPSINDFKAYAIDKILINYDLRFTNFINSLISAFQGLQNNNVNKRFTLNDGFNTDPIKQQSYDFFKVFNDKWTAGNSLGQRTLLEEFMFIDRANVDIGNRAYLNIEKLIAFDDAADNKTSLLSGLVGLIKDTGFDLRGMPAYVNFYGNDFTNNGNNAKITPSRKVAKDLFGTYLEVDYQESTPKILIQYVGPTSKQPSDMTNDNYLFNDDACHFESPDFPLRVTSPKYLQPEILKNSNRVVGFEVNIGDQNQSMFKSIQLDQETLKNTSEFFLLQENLGRSETGAATAALDTNLFNLYRLRSYTCDVTSLGNAMIQPTMYFYLKNVPMFRGTYWITDVTHDIKPNNITTKFKGVRLNKAALPDPSASFITTYKPYFERILNKATTNQPTSNNTTTQQTVTTKSGSATVDMKGTKVPNGETTVSEISVDKNFGINYNGYNGEKYITKVTDKSGRTWYKAIAVTMGGDKYPIAESTEMSLFSKVSNIKTGNSKTETGNAVYFASNKITWGTIKNYLGVNYENNLFYSLRFNLNPKQVNAGAANNIFNATTSFMNPNTTSYTASVSPIILGIDNTVYPNMVQGAINIGPSLNIDYGIGLSRGLMKQLGLKDGEPVYFNLLS